MIMGYRWTPAPLWRPGDTLIHLIPPYTLELMQLCQDWKCWYLWSGWAGPWYDLPPPQDTWMMHHGNLHVRLIWEPVASSHWLSGGWGALTPRWWQDCGACVNKHASGRREGSWRRWPRCWMASPDSSARGFEPAIDGTQNVCEAHLRYAQRVDIWSLTIRIDPSVRSPEAFFSRVNMHLWNLAALQA